MTSAVQRLIDEARHRMAVLEASERRFSRELAPKFRLFEPFRIDEVTLSRCLGTLLDPNASHGQGTLFLDAFLDEAGIDRSKYSTSQARLSLEKITPQGRRIDLVIELEKFTIGIENKPWANDQPDQLQDYADYLRDLPGKAEWKLLYLANGDPGTASISDSSRHWLQGDDRFMIFSFHRLESMLRRIAPHARALAVRVYVEELSRLIRHRVNGEIEMNRTTEVEEMIRGDEEKTHAALSIVGAWHDISRSRLETLHEQLKAAWKVKMENTEFQAVNWSDRINDRKQYAWCGFLKSADQAFMPCFEFGQAGLGELYWGISTVQGKYPVEHKGAAKEIASLMQTEFSELGQKSAHWAWYLNAGRTPVGEEYVDWEASPRPWVEIESGELAGKTIALVQRIYAALEDRPDLLRGRSG